MEKPEVVVKVVKVVKAVKAVKAVKVEKAKDTFSTAMEIRKRKKGIQNRMIRSYERKT